MLGYGRVKHSNVQHVISCITAESANSKQLSQIPKSWLVAWRSGNAFD